MFWSQFSVFEIDHADRRVEETHLPLAGFGLFDRDGFAHERAANVDEVAPPFDLAVAADLAHRRLGRIIGLGKAARHGAARRLVEARRRLLAQRLMRALLVIVAGKSRK